jgi:DNA helicase II / ATP-dependent DNA helicase PcrA
MDEGKRKPRSVDDDFMDDVKVKTRDAATALRSNKLQASPAPKKCTSCDYRGMCTAAMYILPPRKAAQ